jgi:DNA integrity scanning protein DisA with diadenylate cyclase activity
MREGCFLFSMLSFFSNVIKLLLNYVLNVNNILYLLEKQLKSCFMKKYIVIATLLLSGMIFAQNTIKVRSCWRFS